MSEIVIVYSTTDGQTLRISQRLEQVLEHHGDRVTLIPIAEALDSDLRRFDKIVIGASIRYGKHGKPVCAFINKNVQLLESKPNAFFSVSLVARKPGRSRPETNPYVRKFLRKIPWRPMVIAVFAGRVDYRMYRYWDRQMIRLIMWMTHGPTDLEAAIEYTDWQQVEDFALLLSDL